MVSGPTTRGAPTDAEISGIQECTAVLMPAASTTRATSPTDRQQKGHTGTKSARSTSWRTRASAIFVAVSSTSSSVFRM